MALSVGALRSRIQLLRDVDRHREVFGASSHDWSFGAPVSTAEIAALEQLVGPLPPQYRTLLLELGGHGAGPYYGLAAATPLRDEESEQQPDPRRPFRGGAHPLDGTLYLAEQGCGGRSLLVLAGPHAGEVWSDWTRVEGELSPEAPSLFAWYEAWLDRALLEWTERAAPRIAVDGPDDPAELEAIADAYEAIARVATKQPAQLRTLGYLHVRERRWDDARAAFDLAATTEGTDGKPSDAPAPLRHRDLARMFIAMEAFDEAIKDAERGLALGKMYYSTRDQLRDALERALSGAGRRDEALAVLEARAAECMFSFGLHHRLARERIARGDYDGACAALERAANFTNILGRASTLDERLAASFEPIIAELHGAKDSHVGALFEALVAKIRTAN